MAATSNLAKKNLYSSTLELISKVRLALDYEIVHQYINTQGRQGDFANFVFKSAAEALDNFRSSGKWSTIQSLIKRYAAQDLNSRMQIVKKIVKILDELEAFYREENLKLERKSIENSIAGAKTPFNSKPKLACPDQDITNLEVQYVKGVGPHMAEKLGRINIFTAEDLINYLPRNHISYDESLPIAELEEDRDVSILGVIDKITAFKSPKKNLVIMTTIIKDNSGKIKLTKYFQGNSTHYYLKQYKSQYPEGSSVICVGHTKKDKFSKSLVLSNAVLEIVSEDFSEEDRSVKAHTAKIVPIYPLTEGLSLMNLRRIIFMALQVYQNNIKEFIPDFIIEEQGLMSYREALQEIHFPTELENKNEAARRLVFANFLLMQTRFMQIRHEYKSKQKGIQFNCFQGGLVDKYIDSLPFPLTGAQKRVFYEEILPDMVSGQPMNRLLQGDVGSGKTVIAFLAALVAVEDGHQAAVMVPTEILAEQHFKKFQVWVQDMGESLNIKVGLLIGKQKSKEKRYYLDGLATGHIDIVVGTHALIQDSVEFAKLGLVVIDEQHRFGVKQREKLAGNAEKLFMTATPIPRTLALASHGDLDMSEIDELPAGRLPIKTELIESKTEAYDLIKTEINKANQAYIVFPLIDESETLSAKAATSEFERLKKGTFKKFTMSLIHGKLKDEEKEARMEEFRKGNVDILVSTTVIEVGVDVPNATVMLIESADRFGLAQLHQLRGRVGRNDKQSYCLLSSSSKTETTRQRLGILTKTNNGFIVAQEDLRIRGAGDYLGTRQSGIPESTLQDLIDQEAVLFEARRAAEKIIKLDPKLEKYPQLKKRMEKNSLIKHLNAG